MKVKNSVYWHFLSIIVPQVVVVFIVLIALYEWVSYNKEYTELSARLDRLSSTYSLLLSEPLAAERFDELDVYSLGLLSDADISYLEITDRSGQSLNRYGVRDQTDPALLSIKSINHVSGDQVIKIGELSIGLTSKHMLDGFYDRLVYEAVLLAAMISIVLFAVRLAYVETIGKPLLSLLQSIEAFNKNRKHIPVEYRYEDELGTVINNFNEMQSHQLTIQNELKNQYFSLEKIVAERTSELEDELINHAETSSKLYSEKQRAQITLNSISDSVVTTDSEGVIEFMNPAAYRLLNFKRGDADGRLFSDVFHLLDIESRDRVTGLVTWCIESEDHRCAPVEFYLKTESEKEYIVEAMLTGLVNVRGDADGVVILIRDITASMQRNRELSYLARHDMLTGLVNRREFETRLDNLLEDARLNEHQHVLFYLDLDFFKQVNDECGHAAGDEVLKLLSEEFKRHLRKEDCIGRLGGDEFGVLLANCDISSAEGVGEKMRHDIEKFRYECDDKTFKFGVSIGVVSITQHAESKEALMSRADASCYRAKQNGRNQIYFDS